MVAEWMVSPEFRDQYWSPVGRASFQLRLIPMHKLKFPQHTIQDAFPEVPSGRGKKADFSVKAADHEIVCHISRLGYGVNIITGEPPDATPVG